MSTDYRHRTLCFFLCVAAFSPALAQYPIPATGLRAWFKADAGIEADVSGKVLKWNDQSGVRLPTGSTVSALPPESSEQPTLIGGILNHQPVLRFDGDDTLLTGAYDLQNGSNDLSIFVVMTSSNPPRACGPVVNYDGLPPCGFSLQQEEGNSNRYAFWLGKDGNWYGGDQARAQLTADQPRIVSLVKTGAVENMYVDQAQVATASVPAGMTLASNYLGIGGCHGDPTSHFKGDIAEVIIYNRGLSETERQQVTNYLDSKFGITPNLAGLRAWFVADAGIIRPDSERVQSWSDQSSVHATAVSVSASGPMFVVNSINGHAALRFNGTDDGLLTDYYDLQNGSNDLSIFVVLKSAKPVSPFGQIVNYDALPPSGFSLQQDGEAQSDRYAFWFGSNGNWYGGDQLKGQLRTGEPQVLSVVKSGTTGTLYVDQAAVAAAQVPATISPPTTRLGLGTARGDPNSHFKGDIAEILVYNRALTDGERQHVLDYLDGKYAITPELPIPKIGLRARFKADAGITLGANNAVQSWADQSGNGILAQATSTGMPTFAPTGLNNNPTVHFSGNSTLLTSASDLQGGSSDLSIFVVMKSGNPASAYGQVVNYDALPPCGFSLQQDGAASSNRYAFWFGSNGNWYGGDQLKAQLSSDTPNILSLVKTGGMEKMYVDQSQVATASVPASMSLVANALGIGGARGDPNSHFTGDISEVIIYNRALSEAERQQVTNYLSDTYGLYGTRFSFTLDSPYTTSAGVYTTDDVLVRTLWRKVSYGAGTFTRSWDGKDDRGTSLTGGPFKIKLIAHNVQYVWDGLMGNTSSSIIGRSHHAAQSFVRSIAVDGTDIFYALGQNEGFPQVRHFKASSPQTATVAATNDLRVAFDLVAADATRVYYATTGGWPNFAGAENITFVAASTVADDKPVTFNFGQDAFGDRVYSAIDRSEIPPGEPNPNKPTGLAVQKTGNILAVSHGGLNVIRLFDKTSGANLNRDITGVTNPQGLAMTPSGDLWVLTGTSAWLYTNLATTPVRALSNGQPIQITGLREPLAISVSPTDGRIIIADGGDAQVLKIFSGSDRAYLGPYPSSAGGYITGSPEVTDDKFQFFIGRDITVSCAGLAQAPDGSVWLTEGATDRLLHFTPVPNGSGIAATDQVMFLVGNDCALANPKNPRQVIGDGWLEFAVDYGKSLRDPGAWTLVKNWAAGEYLSQNRAKYFKSVNGIRDVTTVAGHVFGTINESPTSGCNPCTNRKIVVELPATGPLRICKDANGNDLVLENQPTAPDFYGPYASQPPSFEADGSLRYLRVTNSASGPVITWYQQDFDTLVNGDPRWKPATPLASAPYKNTDPVLFQELYVRQNRHPITSSNILVTFDSSNAGKNLIPPGSDASFLDDRLNWMHLGGVNLGNSSRWAWKSAPSVYSDVPFDGLGSFDIGDGTQYAGGLAMAVDRNIVYSYPGEFWNQSEASQWMHFYDNGLFVSQFGTPGNYRNQYGAALPGFTGLSLFPTMVGVDGLGNPVANGETFLWANDESLHSGVARWHLLGANTVREFIGTLALGGNAALPSPTPSFPRALKATPVSGQAKVNLTWLAPAGVTSYDVKQSTVSGGPYTKLFSIGGTSCDVPALANGTKYYFVVSAAGSSVNSNQAEAFPFDTVGIAGQFAGGQLEPYSVNSAGAAGGKPALTGLPGVLGSISRTDVGTKGYVIYNWADGGTNDNTNQAPFTTKTNLQAPFGTVSVGGNWQNEKQYTNMRFSIDGRPGIDSAISVPGGSTGTINITVSDSQPHLLTVFSPQIGSNQQNFTVRLLGQNTHEAVYPVNEPYDGSKIHVLQFEFTGNVTLSVENSATPQSGIPSSAAIQALFFD